MVIRSLERVLTDVRLSYHRGSQQTRPMCQAMSLLFLWLAGLIMATIFANADGCVMSSILPLEG